MDFVTSTGLRVWIEGNWGIVTAGSCVPLRGATHLLCDWSVPMRGAIIGDIVGSVREFWPTKRTDFTLLEDGCTFTDDTVLTIAVADSLLSGEPYVEKLHEYASAYPNRCYGSGFAQWVESGSRRPYNSWGNGSAMRVSPVALARDELEEVLAEAKRSAEVTHNHPEGVRGAQATATAAFLARQGETKNAIRNYVEHSFGYDLQRAIVDIRPTYTFNESCEGTVPEAIIAFLDSSDYEDAIRLAISLGGDSDTLACITGGIAEAFYGEIPVAISEPALARLDVRLSTVLREFYERYPGRRA